MGDHGWRRKAGAQPDACVLLQWPLSGILISGVAAGAKSRWRDVLLPPTIPRDETLIRQQWRWDNKDKTAQNNTNIDFLRER